MVQFKLMSLHRQSYLPFIAPYTPAEAATHITHGTHPAKICQNQLPKMTSPLPPLHYYYIASSLLLLLQLQPISSQFPNPKQRLHPTLTHVSNQVFVDINK